MNGPALLALILAITCAVVWATTVHLSCRARRVAREFDKVWEQNARMLGARGGSR